MNTSVLRSFIRKYSLQSRTYEEVRIPVQWGHVAGKWWGPTNKRPILAVHGWQDNCGSFDRLIPLLNKDIGILAIDLPGHGYSSKLPEGLFYHNMHYPILIKQLKRYFDWNKISLMGHSLGSISCALYSMIFPDTVDFLICLDGVKPLQKKNNIPRMARGITELLKYDEHLRSKEEPPSYDLESLKKVMSEVNFNSIDIENCHYILERNITVSKNYPNKYYFTRDPRLKSSLILNWAHKDILELAERLTCPVIMTKSTKSPYYEDKQNFYDTLEVIKKVNPNCEKHYVEGTHHVHLNNPEVLIDLLNNFIRKHDKEDRSLGGIPDQIKAIAS